VAELIRGLRAERVRENLERVRSEIADAGRAPREVEILAAVKYVPLEELGVLAEAGITLLGENRAQDLVAKAEAYPDRFTWDFIGALQSRKVRQLVPYVRYIESVASDSALTQLGRHATPDLKVLIEVNVAGEESKSGISPAELRGFIARCPVPVAGLMTMPPLADSAEASRPYFVALRELAERYGVGQLSMGTSQDYLVAVQEGATIVRLGTSLYT
jgi:pyridoxal phosphate enzyme (YggS family)